MNNPWDFATIYDSPDKLKRVEYDEKSLTEFSMGSPLSGRCYIIKDNSRIRLDGFYGGPSIWSDDSKYLAIPKWTRNHNQRMILIEVKTMSIKELKKKYRVLQLESFKEGIIEGIDSPIYQTAKIRVNIEDFKEAKQRHWW